MGAPLELVCAVAAVCCLSWRMAGAASPPTPTPTPSPVGQQGYSRFHANDSLIGQIVPCTHHEKLCLRYNMLYSSERLKCSYDSKVADREDFWHGSGHLTVFKWRGYDPCYDNGGYRMAYDDNCYKEDIVRDVICGCEQNLTQHFLGSMECRCTPPTRIDVEQPEEEGRCRIPDLRFPRTEPSYLRQNVFKDVQGYENKDYNYHVSEPVPRFNCSSEQAQCFSEGKAWVSESRGCFSLLERGPCAEEHVVALELQAARKGHAEATCVHVRGGCPEGHVRMTSDGECHNEEDMRVIIPWGIFRNQFAMYEALFSCSPRLQFEPMSLDAPNTCAVNVSTYSGGCGGINGVPCHSGSGCKRYEVLSKPPKPSY